MMRRFVRQGMVVLAGVAATTLLVTWSSAAGSTVGQDPAPDVEQLAGRVRAIEQALGSPAKAQKKEPISKRLDKLEEAIRELTRATRQPTEQSSGDNVREIQRAMEESAGARDRLQRRLEQLERAFRDLAGTDRNARSPARDNVGDLRRSAEDSARRSEQLERRVNALQRDLRDVSEFARESRDIKSKLDDLRRSMQDIENRVRRLER